jgi:hypothetical protein
MTKKNQKADAIPRAYWRLNYNPPPTFPPPAWMLELDEDLAHTWQEKAAIDMVDDDQ